MRASGQRAHIDERKFVAIFFETVEYCVFGDRVAHLSTGTTLGGPLPEIILAPADRRINDAFVILEPSPDDRFVRLLYFAVLKLLLEKKKCFLIFRNNEAS